jgi:hypothetical protein
MQQLKRLHKYLNPLTKAEKFKFLLLSVLLCATSFLDLIGVVLLALAGTSVLSTTQLDNPNQIYKDRT